MAISNLPFHERPREKLMERGPKSLTDKELLCVIMGRGTRRYPVEKLAQNILDVAGTRNLSQETLKQIPGLGPVKSCQILAIYEWARRLHQKRNVCIHTPEDAYLYLSAYANKRQEHLLLISLDGQNSVIATHIVSIGGAQQANVHPRDVFHKAIQDHAASIILAHNHPSGDCRPSRDDEIFTRRVVMAGRILGIALSDHIIFSTQDLYSFSQHNMI